MRADQLIDATPTMKSRSRQLATPARLIATLAAAGSSALWAQEPAATTPPPPAEPGTLNRLFNTELPDAIGKAKVSLNSRLRYEYADQGAVGAGPNPEASNALTIRTRFGITSGTVYGFQGMLEGENLTAVTPLDNYNAAGSNGQPGRTVIADPPTTEMNQAWLSYSNWDTVLKGGRQRLVLDAARFVGDVDWRQNQQTFDAVSLVNQSVKDLKFTYAYLWEVNRVFGDVAGLPAASPARDFQSDSHIVNVSYGRWKFAKLTAYSYLLDLENGAGNAASCATFGGSVDGNIPLRETAVSFDYHGELAWQTDYAKNPADYQAEYYHLSGGVNVKPFVFGAGYEVLGTDSNSAVPGASVGFQTPLATLAKFNGWADVFLATPGKGLRDLYAFAQVTLPGKIPLRVDYHEYGADSGGGDFGREVNVTLTHKFGKYWSALARYAHYMAEDAPYADVDKVWVQLDFIF